MPTTRPLPFNHRGGSLARARPHRAHRDRSNSRRIARETVAFHDVARHRVGRFHLCRTGALDRHLGRDRSFLRHLSAYERVVDVVRSNHIAPGRLELSALPPRIRDCCYRANAVRDSTGQLIVEFWEEFGYPPNHSGWAYYSGDSAKAALRARGWTNGYAIRPHWYRISD